MLLHGVTYVLQTVTMYCQVSVKKSRCSVQKGNDLCLYVRTYVCVCVCVCVPTYV